MFDYEIDTHENYSINKRNKSLMNQQMRSRFGRLQNIAIRGRNRQMFNARNADRFIPSTEITFSNVVRATENYASSKIQGALEVGNMLAKGGARFALAPAAVMATAMGVGQYFVDRSFDRTSLQDDIKGLTDLLVSETPTLLSAAAFGIVENKISGKFSGNAGSFLSKRLGGGGGVKGKAVSMAAGVATYMLSTSLLKPVQESLTGYISSTRSSGVMSSIVKGSTSQMEASIRQEAQARGIIGEVAIQEYAKTKKLPSTMREMNTKAIGTARRELQSTLNRTEGGFWNVAFNGMIGQWTQETENRKGLEDIKAELTNRRVELYETIDLSNKAIIDFYSRE